MTTPSDPSAELAEQYYQLLVGGSEFRRDSLAIWKPEIMAAIRAAISQASADLRATREKLDEAEAAQFRAERNERDLREEVSAAFRKHGLAAGPQAVDRIIEQRESLRAQNLALEAQVGELRTALHEASADAHVYNDHHSGAFRDCMQPACIKRRNAIVSRTPETALGEMRETVKDILDAVSEEMQPCENEGVPNYPDILDDVHAKLTQLLTTLTGEKK